MTNPPTTKSQRVRFEEVTPTNEIVVYFNAQLPDLIAGTGLPIFPGYDDLDSIQFAYITLPSGNTVVLGQYENAPEIGVDLYVELDRKNNSTTISTNIAALVVETLRYLAIPRATVVWFHPDYETEIELLYSKDGEFESIPKSPTEQLTLSTEYEPIDCFYYALGIYTREKLPEHWAMLQHNLGLAYFDRSKGERWENLKKSIECYFNSLQVFNQDKFPQKWQINQEDLSQSQEVLKIEKQNLIKDILDRPSANRNLKYVDLSYANLSGANLSGANLSGANLSFANLSFANFSDSDMGFTNLTFANLSNANLRDADLSRANLELANLSGSILNCTYLNRANLVNANLMNADLSGANMSFTNMSFTNLSFTTIELVNLSYAKLCGAELSGAELSFSNLIDAELNGAEVHNTRFGYKNKGISESMRQDLIDRGAIFEDAPGDRSESRTLIPR
jgi:uncharacterized protein YjbI with pentapeptide repeats